MNYRTSLSLLSLLCCAALARAGAATNATARAGAANAPALNPDDPAAKPKFTKQQVASRLRQLKDLYERGLLTKEFYDRKVEECQPGDSAAPAAAAPAAARVAPRPPRPPAVPAVPAAGSS